MTVKDIVAYSARLVLSGETADKIERNEQLTSDEQNAVNQLIRAYNMILNEIAVEYLHLYAEESVCAERVAFGEFTYPPIQVVKVEDENGNEVSFTVSGTEVILPKSGCYYIRYAYIPPERSITSNFDYEGSKIGKRAFCYGVASEYCLISGRYEEASNWESKYRKAVTSPLTSTVKTIKGRVWGL